MRDRHPAQFLDIASHMHRLHVLNASRHQQNCEALLDTVNFEAVYLPGSE
jgi:hypothetical protein